MPQKAWSAKRERQYEHIKESLEDRGTKDDKAEEIAARTVNKERARAGESKTASRTSVQDIRLSLKRERFDNVEAHLSGPSLSRQLRALCEAARRPTAG